MQALSAGNEVRLHAREGCLLDQLSGVVLYTMRGGNSSEVDDQLSAKRVRLHVDSSCPAAPAQRNCSGNSHVSNSGKIHASTSLP